MYVSDSIFLDALFLLLANNTEKTKSLVKEFLETHDRLSGKRDLLTGTEELVAVYKSLIKTVISENITQENQTGSKILLLKIKNNEIISNYPAIRDLITDILSSQEVISASQINEYTKRIRNALLQADIDSVTRKIFAQNKTISSIMDVDEQESELLKVKMLLDKSLKNIESRQNSEDARASETYVSLSDKESILKSLNTFVERSVKGVIRTGLQGLNKALGKRGGMGLGETFVFPARSHNYKTGMLVSIMLWTVIYNKIKVKPGKKAMVYFISLEDEVHKNLMGVFKTLYARLEKKHVDLSSLSTEFITEWLQKYFSQFDVELFIDRYTPHEFTYRKFIQRYTAFENMGYEIILVDLDYLSEAKGSDHGDGVSSQGLMYLIKDNYVKFANHAKQCGYLFTTGHQLNRKADDLSGEHRYAVKKFTPAMMADSSDVFRTVDGLIFLNLENNMEGHKFLTAVLRKNRGCDDTPESHKFFAYPFTEFGIEDDLEGIARYVTDIDAVGIEQGATEDTISNEAMF